VRPATRRVLTLFVVLVGPLAALVLYDHSLPTGPGESYERILLFVLFTTMAGVFVLGLALALVAGVGTWLVRRRPRDRRAV
jgi:hypothetical protein